MGMIKPTSVVKEWPEGDSYIIDNSATGEGVLYVGKATQRGNNLYDEVTDWIAAGNTPEPEFTTSETLEQNRAAKIRDIKNEGLSRISAVIPALDSFTEIQLVEVLWPVLNNPNGNANLSLVKDIYLYGKTKISQARTATQAQLDAYDPTTDPGWPS
jgi:hypothetical protein